MASQRSVFGTRELKALVKGWRESGQYAQTDPSGVHSQVPCDNKISFYSI
jgi:hypothetical protein